MRSRSWFTLLALATIPACSSRSGIVILPQKDETPLLDDGGSQNTAFHPDASCLVTEDSPPIIPPSHVPIGSTIDFVGNPPSSGPHYPIWAAYEEYATPVPRGFWLHDTEHGAIVLLYNCSQDGGCPEILSGLRAAAAAMPNDPNCNADAGLRVKILITPDPLIDTPVAAVAWGWTYTAACLDAPTLQDFMRTHYGQAPDNANCTQGQSTF